jgi:hypothetical protein
MILREYLETVLVVKRPDITEPFARKERSYCIDRFVQCWDKERDLRVEMVSSRVA